jgi:hypothetical protein
MCPPLADDKRLSVGEDATVLSKLLVAGCNAVQRCATNGFRDESIPRLGPA